MAPSVGRARILQVGEYVGQFGHGIFPSPPDLPTSYRALQIFMEDLQPPERRQNLCLFQLTYGGLTVDDRCRSLNSAMGSVTWSGSIPFAVL